MPYKLAWNGSPVTRRDLPLKALRSLDEDILTSSRCLVKYKTDEFLRPSLYSYSYLVMREATALTFLPDHTERLAPKRVRCICVT